MKAIIQKDLRENLKVALIGLLIFSLLLLQGYQSAGSFLNNLLHGSSSGQASGLQPLLATSLLMTSVFFCAIFGAALGWLQTRNEAHRDLWAFLIHRPVTRTEIFQGKALAGLCLYAFGAGLPIAILIVAALIPGHVAAPFEWAMVLPLGSIFLMGVAYYFAGLLTGLRQARWYASRTFGLGLAIIASLGVFGFPEFWMSFLLTTVVILILAAAAHGGYQNSGFYRGLPVIGRLALIIAMLAGCGMVLLGGAGLLEALVLNSFTSHAYEYNSYQMTRDGTVYKVTYSNGEMVQIVDLAGHPLLDPKTGQPMDRKEFQTRITYGVSAFTGFKHQDNNRGALQDPGRFFNLINITDKTLWYLDRHGKLIGYDGRTRRFVGNLDAHGYDGTAVSEPFLVNAGRYYYAYYNSYNDVPRKMLATARTVYQVDFNARKLNPVFTVTNTDEIGGYGDQMNQFRADHVKNFFITTRKAVCLMDYEGRVIFNVPYQPGYFEYPQVELSILKTTNDFALWFHPDFELNRKTGNKMPIHIVWLKTEAAETKTADLPILKQPEFAETWSTKLLAALLPPPVHVEFNRNIHNGWNLLSLALAGVCAGIGGCLARRYNFSCQAVVGWVLFIFLLGIPGLLTFLCVQEWPARETCAGCGQLRAVDRETCEHCRAPFAPPEKNGTEIFQPLVKL